MATLIRRLLLLLAGFTAIVATGLAQGPAAAQRDQSELILKPNDTIRMEVFGEPDLTTESRILQSGEVVFPLIDAVSLQGLTLNEAMDRVRNEYASKYLVDPKVQLTIIDYAADYVSVIGSVNNPGQFTIPKGIKFDLSTALATAGGLNEVADRNRIELKRADGSTAIYEAESAERGGAATVRIQPGDRIVVHQSPFVGKTVTVLGSVRKPGPVPMPVNGRLDIVAAIARAGGFSELANQKKVSVNRGGRVTLLNIKEMTKTGDERYYLHPNDIVTVAERFF